MLGETDAVFWSEQNAIQLMQFTNALGQDHFNIESEDCSSCPPKHTQLYSAHSRQAPAPIKHRRSYAKAKACRMRRRCDSGDSGYSGL
jgi:hypothetical protein